MLWISTERLLEGTCCPAWGLCLAGCPALGEGQVDGGQDWAVGILFSSPTHLCAWACSFPERMATRGGYPRSQVVHVEMDLNVTWSLWEGACDADNPSGGIQPLAGSIEPCCSLELQQGRAAESWREGGRKTQDRGEKGNSRGIAKRRLT